jgi:ATP-dependent DNA helicase RecG
LRIANLATDGRILDAARKEAFDLIEEDGRLEKPQNRMIRETYMKRYEGKFGLMKVG